MINLKKIIAGAFCVAQIFALTTTALATETTESKTAPEIRGVYNIKFEAGSSFKSLALANALDAQDGDISSKIRVIGAVYYERPGVYDQTFAVTDSNGNTTTETRYVTVLPKGQTYNNAPVLEGVKDVTIEVGDKFSSLDGVYASDFEDGVMTSKISVVGPVYYEREGVYDQTFTVTDSDGNTTTKTRYVTVRK